MDARSVRMRAVGAVQLVAALVGLATPPLLLATVVGNPLPAWPIDWGLVVESVQVGLVPSSVWVNVLAVLAWLAWLVLLVVLTLEVVTVARNRPSAAAVPGWIRHLAQTLVAAAIALAGPGQQPVAAAVSTSTFVAAAAPAHSGNAAPVEAEPAVDGRLVTVGEGDSWGGFASDVLGDASLGPQLREANLGRNSGDGQTITESTAFVEPGWRLFVPAHLDAGPTAGPQTADAAVDDEETRSTWEVESGDHFWTIAEETLAEAWCRAPTDAEIVPYWRQLVDANRDRLLPAGDPDLIYPGQQFVVPTAPPDPSGANEDEVATDDAHGHEASGGSGWRSAIEDPDPSHVPTPEPSASAHGWRTAIERPAPEVGREPTATSVDAEEPRTAFGAPAGLATGAAAATLLATGVVATIRWRRRTALQQRGPRMRLPTPLPEVEGEVTTLEAAAAAEGPLNDLGALLLSIPEDVHPVLVRASDHGEVALYFDEQQSLPEPPSPWTLAEDGTDGPVGWCAHLGDHGPERSFGLPLLVTLGRTGTSMLLANVAAMRMLSVEGPAGEERKRLRAMSLEVATSRIAVPVEVAVAGDDRLASLDQVRHIDDPADEIELAMDEVDQGVVLDDRTPRLLVCHHDVVPSTMPEELIGMVGVAIAGGEPAGSWVLEVDDETTGRLRLPDGGKVAIVLPDVDPEVIDDELTRLDEGPDITPPEPESAPASASVDPTTDGHPAVQVASPTEPAWCEVRLLGPVEVVRDGKRIERLPPRVMELLAYLVTHRDGVPKQRLDTVIWAGHATPGLTQRVTSALTKLRKILGDGPDGRPLVPRRQGDEPIELSEHVGCDLDRALAHLALARDLPAEPAAREVAAALELVRGEPFDGRGYSWATDVSQRAIVQLQDAALDAARTLREAGDFETTDRVIGQALKLLDPNGWLYLERAELEKARGHPEQPLRIFELYRRKLADDADEIAGTVATVPLELELAFRELMAGA